MKGKNYLRVFMVMAAALLFSCEQYPGINNTVGYEPEAEDESEPEAQIIGMKIISPPEITVYGRNQTFSSAGLVAGWLYDDGSSAPMEDGEYKIAAKPDMTQYTVHKVTVKAAGYEDDEAYQDSFYIMVMNSNSVLQSITANVLPNKVQPLGLDFDKTGLTVTGNFSEGAPQNLTYYAAIVGYDKGRRGEQTLTAKVNGHEANFNVTTRIGDAAKVSINQLQLTQENYQAKYYRPARIKGEGLNPESSNIKINVYPNPSSYSNFVTLSYGPGGFTEEEFAPAIAAYDPNKTGKQSVSFTVDGRTFPINIFVVDAEPAVWFDYGYMRHAGDTTGHGPGAGKYYAAPKETLVIAPVRFLVGYNADHSDAGASYNWTVSGNDSARTYTTSNGGEFLHITPKTAGSYTISVSVTGKNYITGGNITKPATTELVCYNTALPAGNFVSPLRNFGAGQFAEGGTGYGWSLGSAGGYMVWTVGHQASYNIIGNPMSSWHEAGVVWIQEDGNGNGLPDEMWYELRGGEDDDPKWKNYITRRYAVTYVKGSEHGTVNEYDQLIREVYWADSRGRSHMIPGGFPNPWGVSGNRVTYTCTLLRDDGRIATAQYGHVPMSGYVDALGTDFSVNKAMRANGDPITLSAVKFIKVQTAVFHYGGTYGDVSTEIKSADFLGVTTDFPSP